MSSAVGSAAAIRSVETPASFHHAPWVCVRVLVAVEAGVLVAVGVNVSVAVGVGVSVAVLVAVGTAVPVLAFEPPSVLHYAVGQQFTPHFDFLDPTAGASSQLGSAGQRIATLLVALNDDFDGGETQFLTNSLRWRGKTASRSLFFRSIRTGDL